MRKLKHTLADIDCTTCILTSDAEVEFWVTAHMRKAIPLYGIDIETAKKPKFRHHPQAGLDPILTDIRLIQIHDGTITYIIDLFKTPNAWEILKPFLNTKMFVAHFAKFELKHFTYNGIPDIDLHCSMIASQLTYKATHEQFETVDDIPGDEVYDAGGDGLSSYRFVGHGLSAVTGRLFKISIPKHLQVSDWGNPELTAEQYIYASLDALLTYEVFLELWPVIEEHKLQQAYNLSKALQYPIAEMEIEGFPVNWEEHKKLYTQWGEDKAALQPEVDTWFGRNCNLNSTKQKEAWLRWYLPATGKEHVLEAWPLTKNKSLSFSKGTLTDYTHL